MNDFSRSMHDNAEECEASFLKTLAELPGKPRRQLKRDTLQELIVRLYPELRSAQEKGYTCEELADLVKSHLGKEISPGTLRKYMNKAATIAASNDSHPKPVSLPSERSLKLTDPQMSESAAPKRSEQAATSINPSSSDSASLLQSQPSSSALSPERRERLTQLNVEPDDDIESQFSL